MFYDIEFFVTGSMLQPRSRYFTSLSIIIASHKLSDERKRERVAGRFERQCSGAGARGMSDEWTGTTTEQFT